jgi:hypothetical protein
MLASWDEPIKSMVFCSLLSYIIIRYATFSMDTVLLTLCLACCFAVAVFMLDILGFRLKVYGFRVGV